MLFRSRLRNFRDQAQHLGWLRTAQLRILKRLGVRQFNIRVQGLRNPVAVRTGDSDIYDFHHSLGPQKSQLPLGFTPSVIVDAGANVGYSVLRFFLEFPEARVIALEPGTENLAQLRKNCAGYTNLSVESCGLWNRIARLKIVNPEAGSNAFIVSEDPEGDIPAVSVDDIIAKHSLDRIDLLKVDIEGSEIEVFSNSEKWLPKVRALLIETHDDQRPGCSDAVRRATSKHMSFQGYIGEYEFYRSTHDPHDPRVPA